jgi:hypothetical protein
MVPFDSALKERPSGKRASEQFLEKRRGVEMALVRFRLDEVAAFRTQNKHVDAEHFCVDCAREASKQHTLIPFLDDQLDGALSDFAKDSGAMILCDHCEQVISTYCPKAFWLAQKAEEPGDHRSPILFRKF